MICVSIHQIKQQWTVEVCVCVGGDLSNENIKLECRNLVQVVVRIAHTQMSSSSCFVSKVAMFDMIELQSMCSFVRVVGDDGLTRYLP